MKDKLRDKRVILQTLMTNGIVIRKNMCIKKIFLLYIILNVLMTLEPCIKYWKKLEIIT